MKVKNSLRSLKQRHRDCRVVRRKGRVYALTRRNAVSKPVRVKSFVPLGTLKNPAFLVGFFCI